MYLKELKLPCRYQAYDINIQKFAFTVYQTLVPFVCPHQNLYVTSTLVAFTSGTHLYIHMKITYNSCNIHLQVIGTSTSEVKFEKLKESVSKDCAARLFGKIVSIHVVFFSLYN